MLKEQKIKDELNLRWRRREERERERVNWKGE